MWRDDAYLLDMLIAARIARQFSEELTWENFRRNSLYQHAIAKALENIGEAARKISDEMKVAHPDPGLRLLRYGIASCMITSVSICSKCGRLCNTIFLT